MNEIVPKLGMLALLGIAAPLTGDSTTWAQWGLAGLVVAYTLWRDHSREVRMGAALDRQQDWIRDTLTKALGQNTAALQEVSHLLRRQRHPEE